jgi:hypothetical protein
LVPFGAFHVFWVPQGYGLFESSWGGGLHYLACALAGAAVFRRELGGARGWPGAGPALALTATAALAVGINAWIQAAWPLAPEAYARYEELQIGVGTLSGTYFTGKLPELVFQQTLIYVLVRRLQAGGHRGWRLIGTFALVFGGVHLPLIALKGLAAIPFVVGATSAALVFPPLIAWFRGGIAYSFCVHLLAYEAAGVALRVSG